MTRSFAIDALPPCPSDMTVPFSPHPPPKTQQSELLCCSRLFLFPPPLIFNNPPLCFFLIEICPGFPRAAVHGLASPHRCLGFFLVFFFPGGRGLFFSELTLRSICPLFGGNANLLHSSFGFRGSALPSTMIFPNLGQSVGAPQSSPRAWFCIVFLFGRNRCCGYFNLPSWALLVSPSSYPGPEISLFVPDVSHKFSLTPNA